MTSAGRTAVHCVAAAVLALAAGTTQAATNLVSNGGFETGDFTGWTRSGSLDFTSIDCFGGCFGNFALDSGTQFSMGYISQNLATTPGAIYSVQLWFQSDGLVPNGLSIDIGGVTLFTASNVAAETYTPISFQFGATTSVTQMKLGFRSDPGFVQIDNISVMAVPEPASVSVMALGLALLGLRGLRRRSRVGPKP